MFIVDFNNDDSRPNVDASKLSTIRMKLEEKRRHIEQEKRKMEMALSRQQQKVGKAAFLQAINKVNSFIYFVFTFKIHRDTRYESMFCMSLSPLSISLHVVLLFIL